MESGGNLEFSLSVAPGPEGNPVITVLGEIDAGTAPELAAAFDRAVEIDDHVVLDLRGCSFVDSKGLGVIVGAAFRLRERDGFLKLRGVRPRVLRIFELTGLANDDSIEIEPQR